MKRILIVERDESVLMGLEWTLEAEGYTTTTTWSPQEALRFADGMPSDLLLIYEHLGEIDSPLFMVELKKLQPEATLLLLRTRQPSYAEPFSVARAVVSKWKPDEVKAGVRNCLA